MKIVLGDLEKLGERIFSNRQLGMRFYIRIVIIKVLEYRLCHIEKFSC